MKENKTLLSLLILTAILVSCSQTKAKVSLTAELLPNHDIFTENTDCTETYRHCKKAWITAKKRKNGSPLPAGRLLVFSWQNNEYPEATKPNQEEWLKRELLPRLQQTMGKAPNIRLTAGEYMLEARGITIQSKEFILRYHLRIYEEASLHYIFIWQTDNYQETLILEEETLRALKPKFVLEKTEETNEENSASL